MNADVTNELRPVQIRRSEQINSVNSPPFPPPFPPPRSLLFPRNALETLISAHSVRTQSTPLR